MGNSNATDIDQAFDRIMAITDPPMAIVTVSGDGIHNGCLIGFHTQTSIEPLRYGIWLSKSNKTYELVRQSERIAIHFLSENDFDLAEVFGSLSGDDVDKFSLVPTEAMDPPLISALPNRIVSVKTEIMDDGGDHACITVEPISVTSEKDFVPLRLSHAEKISPGHKAEEAPRS